MKGSNEALVVIDMQNDFMPGGALAVARGDEIIPVINRLARSFEHVVFAQDWHPREHVSFAANHVGRKPFDRLALAHGEQVLWPVHCVQGTTGAAFHAGLDVPHARLVLRKGYRREIDSYSAFIEADHHSTTGLAAYLRESGVTRVWCCGVATDYCVAWTALDARTAGFEAVVVDDACRAIDLDGSLERAWRDMRAAGVVRMLADEAVA